MLVIDGVEKPAHIRIHYPVDVQLYALLAQFPYRLMLTMSFSEAVGERMEDRFEDDLKDHNHRSLDDLVLVAGFSDGSQLAAFLFDPYPFNGRSHVTVCFQPFVQVVEVFVQGFGVVFRSYLVYPRRTVFARPVIGFQKKFLVDQVIQIVEHHLRIVPCLFRNLLEFR